MKKKKNYITAKSAPVKQVEEMLGIYKDPSKIPKGNYCYKIIERGSQRGVFPIVPPKIEICHYWSRNYTQREQESGYCSFLELGDWMEDGTHLLWDQCKECDINLDDDE